MKIFKSNLFYVILLIVISSIIYHQWYSLKVFKYADWSYYYPETLVSRLTSITWVDYSTLGFAEDINVWRKPVEFVHGLFGLTGADSAVADFFIFYLPIITLLPIAFYFLSLSLSKSKIASFLASLYFSFNNYFILINSMGHLYIVVSFIFALFSFYAFEKLLHRFSTYHFFLFVFCLALASFYDMRTLYIASILLFIFLVFKIALHKNITWLFQILRMSAFSCLLLLSLSSFWLLPVIATNKLVSNLETVRGLFGSNFFTFANALTGVYPFWNLQKIEWFRVGVIDPRYWLILPLLIFPLIFKRANKNILLALIIFITGVFFAKQESAPLSGIYAFLFGYLPGFRAFRHSSQFYFIVVLGQSFLFVFLIKLFFEMKSKVAIFLRYTLVLFFLFIIISNVEPIVSGRIDAMYSPTKLHPDYQIFANFVKKQPTFFRTLAFPISSTLEYASNLHPTITIQNSEIGALQSFLTKTSNKQNSSQFGNLINRFSVKYIAVPTEYDVKGSSYFQAIGYRSFYLKKLDDLKYLNQVKIGTKELVLYENEGYRPHIYTTIEKETIKKEVSFENVYFQFRNPTEYKIGLKNVSRPIFLNFSETFHPDWKIKVGKFYWFKVLTEKNYFVSDRNHFENDAQLNSFYIDPVSICKTYVCRKNLDGTYNIELTLYFKPQSYMYFGLIISCITLVGCLFYLAYVGTNILRKKHSVKQK